MRHIVYTELQKPETQLKVPVDYLIMVVPFGGILLMFPVMFLAPKPYSDFAIFFALLGAGITWGIGAILNIIDPEFMKVIGTVFRTLRPTNWPLRLGKFYHG